MSRLFAFFVALLLFVALLPFAAFSASSLHRNASPTGASVTLPTAPLTTPYPILFVTQPPVRADFTTIGSTFGNHGASMDDVARGGALWIRYPDGALKNLTAAAGYGSTTADGFQDEHAIAVRDPAVHWDGQKALFSMVIGAPAEQYDYSGVYYWQIYEISGLGPDDTPVIAKVPNQPPDYNNVSPIYGTDDRIIFTSDRPRNGQRHLYPQLDEYETAATVTGLWRLNPVSGDLRLLNHAPSGDFTPLLDSFGRIVFTQWDHLQRDQQADADAEALLAGEDEPYGTFDYANERADVAILATRTEVFPEPRASRTDLLTGTNLVGHNFNHFFPWTIFEDGTESEVLNHLGRHELHGYIPASIDDDANVFDYYGQAPRFNPNPILNMFQIAEDPNRPGVYYGIDAPEFGTHAAGQVISMTAPPALDADHIRVRYVTHRATASTEDVPANSGHYRDPLVLSDGALVAAHTADRGEEAGTGGPLNSTYAFRLTTLALTGNGFYAADAPLTAGITATIRYWSPDVLVEFTGPLWELSPVEVRARPRPAPAVRPLAPPELAAFQQAGVDPGELRAYLAANDLALAVVRDATTRDDFDQQQPFNLRVAGSGHQTLGAAGAVYEIAALQFFQGDQVRGWRGGGSEVRPGRRVLARVLHDPTALSANPNAGGPPGSVAVAADGSVAAFVPAGRALTWQLTDAQGVAVVRERYWLTFQPGEMRVCGSCHGLSELDQAGQGQPQNTPAALVALLEQWAEENQSSTRSLYLPTVVR
jgi:hypothetical protein